MDLKPRADELSATIDTILSVNTSPSQRAAAHEASELYKTKLDSHVQFRLSTFIIKEQSYPVSTRKFAIQLLQHYIVNSWNISNQAAKQEIQQTLIGCISMPENETQPIFILDAFAKCLTSVALRTWPQYWGSMLADFGLISGISPGHQQIILLSLTRLEEDVISIQPDTVGIVKKRRQELARAVSVQTGDILEFICAKMVVALNEAGSSNSANSQVLSTGLQAYQAYASWANPAHIFSGDKRLEFLRICMLAQLHTNVDLAIDATRTIISVTSSKVPDIDKKQLLQFLTGQCFSSIKEAIKRHASKSAINDKSYQHVKLLAEMVADLGRIVVACFEEDTDRSAIDEYQLDCKEFFQLILDLDVARAPWVRYNLINPLIATFVKSKILMSNPIFREFIAYFLSSLTNDVKTARLDTYTTLELECDDESQCEALFHQYKVSNATLFRTILQYTTTQDFFNQLYLTFLQSFTGGIAVQPLFEGALRIYTGNLPGNCIKITPCDSINKQIQQILVKYLETLQNIYQQNRLPADSAMLHESLEYVGTCFMFLPNFQPSPHAAVVTIVECLSQIILGRIPDESGGDPHDMLKHCDQGTKKWRESRRMASTHVIRLFANHADVVPDQTVQSLLALSQDILENRSDILVEFCNIVEGLLCLSKIEYATGVLKHATHIFYQEPQLCVGNSSDFLKQIGLDLTNPSNIANDMNEEGSRVVRSKINTASNLFQAVFRRVSEDVLKVVLNEKMTEQCFLIPFQVLQANSALWTKSVFDTLKSINCQGLVEISESEKKILLGGERSMQDAPVQSPLDLAVRRIQAFISHNSDQALVTIANMLKTSPMLIEKFENLLNESLFSYLDSFDLYRYKRVVKHFFMPVLPTTPSKSLLTVSLDYMGQRLRREYATIATEIALNGKSTGENEEEAEILRDKHMTILTRDYLNIMRDCCFDIKTTVAPPSAKHKGKEGKKPVPGSPKEWRINKKGRILIFADEGFTDLGNTVFETVLGMLKLINVDSQSANIAAQLLWGLCTEFFHMNNANQENSVNVNLRRMQMEAAGPILDGMLQGLKIHKSGTDVYASLSSLAIEFYFCSRFVFGHCSVSVSKALGNIPNARDATIKKLDQTLKSKAKLIKWVKGYDNAGIYGALPIVDKTSRGIFTILTTGLRLTKQEQERLSRTKAGYDMPPLFASKEKVIKNDEILDKGGLIQLFAEE